MTVRKSVGREWQLVVIICCVCVTGPPRPPSVRGDPCESGPGCAQADSADVQRLVEACAAQGGAEYQSARSELLGLHAECLRPILDQALDGVRNVPGKVAMAAIRVRMQCPRECETFDKEIQAILRDSRTSHAPGKPRPVIFISPDIARFGEDPDMEALILERLFKYEHPSDFRQATVRALGMIGTQQALEALRALMTETSDSGIQGACVSAVGKLSGKLHDTRAAKDLVGLYRSVSRSRGTGAPEETLRRMPPPFQANVIFALSEMTAPEALAALEELRATETDSLLLQRLESATEEVRTRLEREQAEKGTEDDAGG